MVPKKVQKLVTVVLTTVSKLHSFVNLLFGIGVS